MRQHIRIPPALPDLAGVIAKYHGNAGAEQSCRGEFLFDHHERFFVGGDDDDPIEPAEKILLNVPDRVALAGLDLDGDALAGSRGQYVHSAFVAWCFDMDAVAAFFEVGGPPVSPVRVCK